MLDEMNIMELENRFEPVVAMQQASIRIDTVMIL